MANERNKMVQNYCLEDLNQIWPDSSEIWTAKHKILKRRFTLKRLKYKAVSIERTAYDSPSEDKEEGCYGRLMRVTNLLKRLNLDFAPKCYKMIKTNSHLYVVYDQFPHLTLADYLAKENLQTSEKWRLMENLARLTRETHLKEVVLLGLTPENIYIKDNNDVFFGDWTLAKVMGGSEQIQEGNIPVGYQFVADEVKELGMYGSWSDVFSLGKIFEIIADSGFTEINSVLKAKLTELVERMLKKNVEARPKLEEIISFFSSKGKEQNNSSRKAGEEKNSFISQHTLKLKQVKSLNEPHDFYENKTIIKQTQSKPAYKRRFQLSPLALTIPNKNCNAKPESATNSPLIHHKGFSGRLSVEENIGIRSSKNSNHSSQQQERMYKQVASKRNLSFFLLDLSEFVIRMEMNYELGFLLLKQALLILRGAVQKWMEKNYNSIESQRLMAILKNQYATIMKTLQLLREGLSYSLSAEDLQINRELEDQRICEPFFNQKIIEFAKAIVLHCQTNLSGKESVSKLTEVLFKTYMILKKIQDGTYQKFWSKRSSQDFVRLSNQRYLKEQKNLGYRYLKSKIAEILRKK